MALDPSNWGSRRCVQRFADGEIEEVILATNPTVEGEATAYYISEQARAAAVTVSRIAHGVPLGGELEYTDANTLAHALSGQNGGRRVSWTLIESSKALDSLLSDNRHQSMVAIDTEFRRRDTFFPQVALLQLCWGDEPYLIDPLQLDDVSALRAFLIDPSQTKLIHSASEDLEVFSHWLGVLPAPLFDTQRAAALLGLGAGQSYRALVAHFFDIELPKDETQSDWLQRPLTAAQAQYAAQDVTYLHPMGVQLLNLAMERHRLEWILEEGARLRPGGKPPIAKFKTAYRLPPEAAAGIGRGR